MTELNKYLNAFAGFLTQQGRSHNETGVARLADLCDFLADDGEYDQEMAPFIFQVMQEVFVNDLHFDNTTVVLPDNKTVDVLCYGTVFYVWGYDRILNALSTACDDTLEACFLDIFIEWYDTCDDMPRLHPVLDFDCFEIMADEFSRSEQAQLKALCDSDDSGDSLVNDLGLRGFEISNVKEALRALRIDAQ